MHVISKSIKNRVWKAKKKKSGDIFSRIIRLPLGPRRSNANSLLHYRKSKCWRTILNRREMWVVLWWLSCTAQSLTCNRSPVRSSTEPKSRENRTEWPAKSCSSCTRSGLGYRCPNSGSGSRVDHCKTPSSSCQYFKYSFFIRKCYLESISSTFYPRVFCTKVLCAAHFGLVFFGKRISAKKHV